MPAPPDLLDRTLRLGAGDPNRAAAEKWLGARAARDIGDDTRAEYVGFVYDRYFAVTTAAIALRAAPDELT